MRWTKAASSPGARRFSPACSPAASSSPAMTGSRPSPKTVTAAGAHRGPRASSVCDIHRTDSTHRHREGDRPRPRHRSRRRKHLLTAARLSVRGHGSGRSSTGRISNSSTASPAGSRCWRASRWPSESPAISSPSFQKVTGPAGLRPPLRARSWPSLMACGSASLRTAGSARQTKNSPRAAALMPANVAHPSHRVGRNSRGIVVRRARD